jgi:2-haloalkanoic acid dehalogenase type II
MPNTVVFDALGTLLSLKSLEQAVLREFPSVDASMAHQILLLWFNTTQRDYMSCSMTGKYIPIGQVFAGGLDRCLRVFGLHSTAQQRDLIMNSFQNDVLPCKSATRALEKLAKAGFQVVVLTNGGEMTVRKALERGDCLKYFKSKSERHWNIISCDEIRKAKTDPSVYQAALDYIQIKPNEDVWMVAAHHWDTHAAQTMGFKGAFVQDEEVCTSDALTPPHVQGIDLEHTIDGILHSYK